MKNALVDLNVIIDFLNRRAGHQDAARIVDACVRRSIAGHVCAHEFTTLAYFLLKEHRSAHLVRQTLHSLLDIFAVLPVNNVVLRTALQLDFNDYEDAVIEACAQTHNMECIVTRNTQDFRHSRIKVFTPSHFLQVLAERR
jgi:predicted nucleic acid-binding protein